MTRAIAGSAAVHGAPVQSSFTSWRKLNKANTESGMRDGKIEQPPAARRIGCLIGRRARETVAAMTASTPVGVISTMMEPISLCRANCGVSARRREV